MCTDLCYFFYLDPVPPVRFVFLSCRSQQAY